MKQEQLASNKQQGISSASVASTSAAKLVDHSLDLMGLMAQSDQRLANTMVAAGALEECVAVLDDKEATTEQKRKVVAVLNNVSNHRDKGMSSQMVALSVSAKIAAALKDINDEGMGLRIVA